MLRITIQKDSGPAALKLEGKLAGPWMEELKNVWRFGIATEAILFDLFDVSFVDASGKDLFAQMWQGGPEFVADSPLMNQVIEEVNGSPQGWGKVARLILETTRVQRCLTMGAYGFKDGLRPS